MAKKFVVFDIYDCIARDLIKEMWSSVVKVRTNNPWKIYAAAKKTCPRVSAIAIINCEHTCIEYLSSELENKQEYVCFFFIKDGSSPFWKDAMELAKLEIERQKKKEARHAN